MPAAVLRQKTASLIWAVVVGAHLGNYFCSGVAKLRRAAGALDLAARQPDPDGDRHRAGTWRQPAGHLPDAVAVQLGHDLQFALAFNFFVLGAQLLSPLAILRVRWLLFFTLLFDIFHIGVYLTLGALFHFWIAVNLIVYASAWRLKDNDITPMMKVACIAATLFGHTIFYTNFLGWLDAAKLASPQFYAVTKDGHEVWMPPAYFGIYSYSIAHTALYVPDGHFPHRIGGNSHNLDEWRDASSCSPATHGSQEVGGATLASVGTAGAGNT